MGAFLIWGLFPLYLRPLRGVGAVTILSHRMVWCCLLVNVYLAARGELGAVRAALALRSTRVRLAASGSLITSNWLVFVWAVGSGHVVEASLGYFINPLVNVLLGVLLLGERLRHVQWAAVLSAAVGVVWLTVQAGRPPWIALALAFSFSGYGLLRKVVAVEAVPGLAAETTLLAPIAAAWLAWQAHAAPGGWFGTDDGLLRAWLVASGVVTAVPLALFAYGARRIAYSTVGIIQYIGPTLQLTTGIIVYGEPFPAARVVGFALIWCALVLYAAEGVWRARHVPR
jgi:chloramphenicol-sensitive protein RarD